MKHLIWRLLTASPWVNGLFSLPGFRKHHHRFPRHPASPQAILEDYVFYHMIRPWTPFHETCVDKQYAKLIAVTLAPSLKSARTAAILPIRPKTTLEELGKFLYPYLGKPFVAKPTHSSGGILFLNQPAASVAAQVPSLLRLAKQNYFFTQFETQYLRLPHKILIEASLGPQPPSDFRFYCVRGKVLFCQFDQGRFADHRQALFTVPGHQNIPIENQYPLPKPLPEKPAHWDEMLQIASDLSKPFDFVRVDLYDLPDGVYFSEFTFTPNAAVFPFRDPAFSRKCLEEVLKFSSQGTVR